MTVRRVEKSGVVKMIDWSLADEETRRKRHAGKTPPPALPARDEPRGPSKPRSVSGSAVPKAGKRFGGEGGTSPQGA